MPALLVGVECGPDDADEDALDGDDQSDVADERLIMFDTMPTPALSMKIAKNRTQKPTLFVVTATVVASAVIDMDPLPRSGVRFAGEMLLVRPSYWLLGRCGRHTGGT